jgi:hypothetical protein
MGAIERQERQQLRTTAQQVAGWVDQAQTIVGHRANVTSAANEAVAALRSAALPIRRDGAVAWRVLPLRPADGQRLAAVARHQGLPAVSVAERAALDGLTSDDAAALRQVKSVVGTRRFFTGKAKREAGARAAELLTRYQAWGDTANLPHLLDRLTPATGSDPADVPLGDALADRVGLVARIADLGGDRALLDGHTVAGLADAVRHRRGLGPRGQLPPGRHRRRGRRAQGRGPPAAGRHAGRAAAGRHP